MTLLTICNALADYTSGPRPATIAQNTNPDAQNYLRIVNKVGKKLMKVYPWNILRKEHTFTAAGTETLIAAASMPTDFDRFIPETFWDRSTSVLLSGPITAPDWAGLKASSYTGDNPKFTYRGGIVLAIPTVSSGDSMAFEYIASKYLTDTTGVTPKVEFTVDTDVALLDEELIALAATYDWLVSEGQPAQGAFADFKNYFDTLQDNENATENIMVTADLFAQSSRHSTGIPVASRTVVLSS